MVLWAPQWEFPAQWALKKHLQVCVWQQHRAITSHQCHRQPSPGQPPAQGLCWDRGRAVSDTWGDPCWRGQGSRDPTALLLVLHQCLSASCLEWHCPAVQEENAFVYPSSCTVTSDVQLTLVGIVIVIRAKWKCWEWPKNAKFSCWKGTKWISSASLAWLWI